MNTNFTAVHSKKKSKLKTEKKLYCTWEKWRKRYLSTTNFKCTFHETTEEKILSSLDFMHFNIRIFKKHKTFKQGKRNLNLLISSQLSRLDSRLSLSLLHCVPGHRNNVSEFKYTMYSQRVSYSVFQFWIFCKREIETINLRDTMFFCSFCIADCQVG